MNGAATPGAGSSSGGGGCGIIPHMNSQPPLGSTELGVTVGNVGNAAGAGSSGGQAGDRGSCSADSGVRGSSDRESGGATSVGGNLSDSTTDGKRYAYFRSLTIIVVLFYYYYYCLFAYALCPILTYKCELLINYVSCEKDVQTGIEWLRGGHN